VTLCTQLLQQPAAVILVADERIATQGCCHEKFSWYNINKKGAGKNPHLFLLQLLQLVGWLKALG
jgi:hypothetical protein